MNRARSRAVRRAIVVLAAAAALAGCASDGSASSTPAETSSADASKASANFAAPGEIEGVLTDAGVTDAKRWAGVVEQNRPYPTDDAKLPKLRQALAGANAPQNVVEAILRLLRP